MAGDTSTSRQKGLILYAIWMTALAGAILWTAWVVREIILLVYIAGLLAVGFSPVVRLIERQRLRPVFARRLPRWFAILVLYLFILGTLIGIAALVAPPLIEQARGLWDQKSVLFERVQSYLVERGVMSEPLTLREAVEQTPVGGSDAVGTVFGAVRGFIGGIFGFFTIVILTFYLLVDSANLRQAFLRLFPRPQRPRIDAGARDVTVKVSAWLSGQLFLGGVIGATTALGLWLLGIPFFYVLALISAVGELIPVVGPILAAIPALLVAVTVSYQKALLVLIFFIIQQQIENHLLVPKIMERQVGVTAPMIIISILVGGKLLGILGALLAVPTAAILQVLVTEILEQREKG